MRWDPTPWWGRKRSPSTQAQAWHMLHTMAWVWAALQWWGLDNMLCSALIFLLRGWLWYIGILRIQLRGRLLPFIIPLKFYNHLFHVISSMNSYLWKWSLLRPSITFPAFWALYCISQLPQLELLLMLYIIAEIYHAMTVQLIWIEKDMMGFSSESQESSL